MQKLTCDIIASTQMMRLGGTVTVKEFTNVCDILFSLPQVNEYEELNPRDTVDSIITQEIYNQGV